LYAINFAPAQEAKHENDPSGLSLSA
jgi:hypothetical protein